MTDQTTTQQRSPVSTTSTSEDTTDTARDRARDAADTGKQEAGRVVDEARMHTSRLVGETGDRAREHADQQLTRTAGVIDQLGTELDEMASGASRSDGYLTALARDGAHTAHQLSQRLENGGVEGVLDDVTRFARRRPGAFLAASFGVGLLLGRVTRNADFGRIKQEMSDHDRSGTDGSSATTGSLTGSGTSGSAMTGSTMTGSTRPGPTTGTSTTGTTTGTTTGAPLTGSPMTNEGVTP